MLCVIVMTGRDMMPSSLASLFVLAGLFHGSAYANALLGAEATPLAAYLLGFSFIQYAVAVITTLVVREGWKAADTVAVQPRLAGALIAGVGATFLIEHVESITFPSM